MPRVRATWRTIYFPSLQLCETETGKRGECTHQRFSTSYFSVRKLDERQCSSVGFIIHRRGEKGTFSRLLPTRCGWLPFCCVAPNNRRVRSAASGANCWVNERERGFTASSFDERRCAQSTQTLYRSFSFSLLLFHRIKKNATFVTSPFAVMQRDLALCSHSEQRLSYTNQTGILNIFLHICPRAIR